jgi:hypothetical protein
MSIGSFKTEVVDQTLHFTVAALIVASAQFGLIPAMIAGFLAGMVREVTELGLPVTLRKVLAAPRGQALDLTFWTLGGGAAWLLTA